MAATEVRCEVTRHEYITPTVFELDFKIEPKIPFVGGQFISVVVPNAGPSGRDLRRAYSIASGPDQEVLELCVKLVEHGPGTNFLNQLRAGDHFRGFFAYGTFVYKHRAGRDACFISTGTGIAPFRSMMESKAFWHEAPRKSWMLFGATNESELLYDAKMKALQKNLEMVWAPCISRPVGAWDGFKGRVTDYLRREADSKGMDWLNTDYYLCGSSMMIDEVKQILAERGVQKDAIHQEVYYKTPSIMAPSATT